ARFADQDAIIVHEGGSIGLHSFAFNPLGGRELFFYYGAHLGSGVGTSAGVKLARPNQQVICLVGDGSFVFGPTALWNMARLELPVIVVVYNNHAYGGPHSRVIDHVPGGRMVQTKQFYHDYLGSPDMDMASIAKGFGVAGEIGRDVYEEFCVTCHGKDLVNPGGVTFDLRKFPKDDFARFQASVLNGKGLAMPPWRGKVSDDDLKLLWAYVQTGG